MKKNVQLKILSVFMVLIILCSNFPIVANASNNDFYAQYSGSTTASWGYKPDCTFTVNKIVGDKFKGSFVATNLGSYNLSKQVEGVGAR